MQRNVIERLVTYTKMYELARRFALAYDLHYKQLCKVSGDREACKQTGGLQIELFSYHKLVVLYGRRHELVMIVSYKPQNSMFWVNFAQAAGRRWNAHSFVAISLSNRLNRDLDMIELVNYVVNTDRAINAIYQFARPRLRSLKPHSQMMLMDEKSFQFESQVGGRRQLARRLACCSAR